MKARKKVRRRLVGFYRNWQTNETTTDRLDKGISWPTGLLRIVSPIFPAHLLISPWPLYTYIFHLCIHGPAHAPDYRVDSHLFCIKRSEIKIAYNCVFDVRKYSRPCTAFAARFCVSGDSWHRAIDSSKRVGCNVDVHTIDCDRPRHIVVIKIRRPICTPLITGGDDWIGASARRRRSA